MKVYLDDERQTPAGWRRVYWPEDAIELLVTGKVTEISLDHDLGDDDHGTGYDVVLWIEEQVFTAGFKPPKMKVHSANSSARAKMESGIRQIGIEDNINRTKGTLDERRARAKKDSKERYDKLMARTPEEVEADQKKLDEAFEGVYSMGSPDLWKYYDEEMDGPIPFDGQIIIDENGVETVYKAAENNKETVVEGFPGDPFTGKTNWEYGRKVNSGEIVEEEDPECPTQTEEQLSRFKRVVKNPKKRMENDIQ